MDDFQTAQKCAENYPELLHPVQGNDKIFILNHILQVMNHHAFKMQLKNANDTENVECVQYFKHIYVFEVLYTFNNYS